MLLKNADPNTPQYGSDGGNILHVLASVPEGDNQKSANMVKMIIDHGCNVNSRDNDGKSPFFIASAHNQFEMMELLLHHGSNINEFTQPVRIPWTRVRYKIPSNWSRYGYFNYVSQTPLLSACQNCPVSFPIIKYLLENRADVHVGDESGCTPLILCLSRYGIDTRLTELLLKYGSDPNATTVRGECPLSLALRFNQDSVKPLLEAGAHGDNLHPGPPGHLLQLGSRCTPLMFAIKQKYKDLDSLELIIKRTSTSTLNYRGPSYSTALLLAINENESLVGAILEAGADPNIPNNVGMTPLAQAAYSGSLETVRLLLLAGADTKNTTSFDWCIWVTKEPLLMAASSKEQPAIVNMFNSAGHRSRKFSRRIDMFDNIHEEGRKAVKELSTSVLSLKEYSRIWIWRSVHFPMAKCLKRLKLPLVLQRYLALEDYVADRSQEMKFSVD